MEVCEQKDLLKFVFWLGDSAKGGTRYGALRMRTRDRIFYHAEQDERCIRNTPVPPHQVWSTGSIKPLVLR